MNTSPRSSHQRIYAVVRRIPRGRVATYGQIAELAGFAGQPRLVGYAMRALDDGRTPWQRVINVRGEISRRADSEGARVQRRLLEAEGVHFDDSGRIALDRFRWRPRTKCFPTDQ